MTDAYDRADRIVVIEHLYDARLRLSDIEDSGLALLIIAFLLEMMAAYLEQRWVQSGNVERDGR